MKRTSSLWIAGIALAVFATLLFAANPTFVSFIASQFGYDNTQVWIKSGAQLTNVVNYGTFQMPGVPGGPGYFAALDASGTVTAAIPVGGGGGSTSLNPSQFDTNALLQSEIKSGASITNAKLRNPTNSSTGQPLLDASPNNVPLSALATGGGTPGQLLGITGSAWGPTTPTLSLAAGATLVAPQVVGSMGGQIYIPTTSTNPVYYSPRLYDTYGPAARTNQELTAWCSDGIHDFEIYNDSGDGAGNTNGCCFVVKNHATSTVVAANWGQPGSNAVSRSPFNVACGAEYANGRVFVIITRWDYIGTNYPTCGSNAVCVFETNGYMDSLHLLGQQPRTLQCLTHLTNGTVAVGVFSTTNNASGTNDAFAANNLLVYETNGWTTNGQTPLPLLNTPSGLPYLGMVLNPSDHNTLYLMMGSPPWVPSGANMPVNASQWLWKRETNGYVWPVVACYNPYDFDPNGSPWYISSGSICFQSNNPLVIYHVRNWMGPEGGGGTVNTNMIVGWSLDPTNTPIVLDQTGFVFTPSVTQSSNAMPVTKGGISHVVSGDRETLGGWQLWSNANFYGNLFVGGGGNVTLDVLSGQFHIVDSFNGESGAINIIPGFQGGYISANVFTNDGSGQGFAASGHSGNGGLLTNLNGANIQASTINSNKFDAPTLALLGSGGGGIATNAIANANGAGTNITLYGTNNADRLGVFNLTAQTFNAAALSLNTMDVNNTNAPPGTVLTTIDNSSHVQFSFPQASVLTGVLPSSISPLQAFAKPGTIQSNLPYQSYQILVQAPDTNLTYLMCRGSTINGNAASCLFLATSTNGGGTYTPNWVIYTNGAIDAGNFAFGSDANGTLFVACQNRSVSTGNFSSTFFLESTNHGQSFWSNGVIIPIPTGLDEFVPYGRITKEWGRLFLNCNGDKLSLLPASVTYCYSSLDDGMTWTGTVIETNSLTEPNETHILPIPSLGLGYLYASIRCNGTGTNDGVRFSYSTNYGGTWYPAGWGLLNLTNEYPMGAELLVDAAGNLECLKGDVSVPGIGNCMYQWVAPAASVFTNATNWSLVSPSQIVTNNSPISAGPSYITALLGQNGDVLMAYGIGPTFTNSEVELLTVRPYVPLVLGPSQLGDTAINGVLNLRGGNGNGNMSFSIPNTLSYRGGMGIARSNNSVIAGDLTGDFDLWNTGALRFSTDGGNSTAFSLDANRLLTTGGIVLNTLPVLQSLSTYGSFWANIYSPSGINGGVAIGSATTSNGVPIVPTMFWNVTTGRVSIGTTNDSGQVLNVNGNGNFASTLSTPNLDVYGVLQVLGQPVLAAFNNYGSKWAILYSPTNVSPVQSGIAFGGSATTNGVPTIPTMLWKVAANRVAVNDTNDYSANLSVTGTFNVHSGTNHNFMMQEISGYPILSVVNDSNSVYGLLDIESTNLSLNGFHAGYVGINNTNPGFPLDVTGDVNFSGLLHGNLGSATNIAIPCTNFFNNWGTNAGCFEVLGTDGRYWLSNNVYTNTGGSQTPWTGNVDAAGNSLSNMNHFGTTGSSTVGGGLLVSNNLTVQSNIGVGNLISLTGSTGNASFASITGPIYGWGSGAGTNGFYLSPSGFVVSNSVGSVTVAGGNVTATGTFTGNGSGVTNLAPLTVNGTLNLSVLPTNAIGNLTQFACDSSNLVVANSGYYVFLTNTFLATHTNITRVYSQWTAVCYTNMAASSSFNMETVWTNTAAGSGAPENVDYSNTRWAGGAADLKLQNIGQTSGNPRSMSYYLSNTTNTYSVFIHWVVVNVQF